MTQLLDVYESLLVRKKKNSTDLRNFEREQKKNKDARRKLIERVKE